MPAAVEHRLFLIDGYALIYRAFYAMMNHPLRTSRGENTSAVFGVTSFLLRLLRQHRPTHVAWVHDAGSSQRDEIFPEYKATRERLEPALQADFDRSVERVAQLLGAMRIPLIAVQGYEADDVLGTLATQAAAEGVPSVLVSGDKDLYQLVSDQISLLNPGRGGPGAVDEQWVDLDNAAERLGVPPERVVDYLALVGDSSDNVPGVRGVGPKTARALIERWGDLESILAHAAEAPGKRVQEALRTEADRARLSRQLVRIQRDVPVAIDIASLQVREPDAAALRQIFGELEFHEFLRQFEPARVDREGLAREVRIVAREAVPEVVRSLGKGPIVVRTVLADSGRRRSPVLIGLALSREATDAGAWYLPFAHAGEQADLLGQTAEETLPPLDDPSLQSLANLLEDPGVSKMGHDLKRDALALRAAGVVLRGVSWDAMLASFVLNPGRRSHALEALAVDVEQVDLEGPPDPNGAGTDHSNPTLGHRAAAALAVVGRLHRRFGPQLETQGLARLLADVELPLIDVLADMEWRGIAVDIPRLRALSGEFGRGLAHLERAIHEEAGGEFNIQSTPQLRHVLFEKLQLPVIKRTKTGASTDADVLEQLAAMGFTAPALLLEFRELFKLKSTYVDVLPERVDPDTGRIHTRFHQTGAATGRLSSSDPNLQNIPVRTSRGELIRQCFVAAEGCELVVADYSQIELRLLAHLSGDPAFLQAFDQGADVHRQTAAVVFGVPAADVTAEMRGRAKTINFATIYGQGPFALSRQLGITQEEAKEFIRLYFERFAGVRSYLDATVASARERGFVETLFGRRRYIPELRETNRSVWAFGERTAMNSPLQGSAADLIKVAMIRIHHAFVQQKMGSGILLQVHDELVIETPSGETAEAVEIVRREMEGAAALRVPLVVDVGVGADWLNAKP
ncbi:MAG: DNA polymerase I [Gemmatimonadetes bacterium RBG_16_66_8]|nr:MAG: DNA polymerase I [Gemmatimonadetes bacterium RBG_16_66_8]